MPEPATVAVTPSESATPAPRSWLEALRVYLEPSSLRMLTLGFSAGPAAAAGAGHIELPAARGRHRPQHDRLPELGRAGLRLQVGLGATGGPPADPRAHARAGPPAKLVVAVTGGDHRGAGGHGPGGPAPDARADRLVRTGCGFWLGHAGHRAGRLPHRVRRHQPPGRAGRQLPDRLPSGHDLGRRGGACGSPRARKWLPSRRPWGNSRPRRV